MSKSMKKVGNDKIKVKPRRYFVEEIEEDETEKLMIKVIKGKNDLRDFEEYIEDK